MHKEYAPVWQHLFVGFWLTSNIVFLLVRFRFLTMFIKGDVELYLLVKAEAR